LREPAPDQEFSFAPRKKSFFGRGLPGGQESRCSFHIFFEKEFFMNELMCEKATDAIETLRFKSRFDEFREESYYKDELFIFQSVFIGKADDVTISISTQTSRYGIRKPVAVSGKLYRTWIDQGSCLTIQRIGVLCHAFLYAVDLDQHNALTLEFPVPFFTQGVGYTPVNVRAELIGTKRDHLYFDLA
jgi:hypothetical protein